MDRSGTVSAQSTPKLACHCAGACLARAGAGLSSNCGRGARGGGSYLPSLCGVGGCDGTAVHRCISGLPLVAQPSPPNPRTRICLVSRCTGMDRLSQLRWALVAPVALNPLLATVAPQPWPSWRALGRAAGMLCGRHAGGLRRRLVRATPQPAGVVAVPGKRLGLGGRDLAGHCRAAHRRVVLPESRQPGPSAGAYHLRAADSDPVPHAPSRDPRGPARRAHFRRY